MSTEIPDAWTKIDLRREVDFLPGYPFNSELFNQDQGFPLVRIRDLLNHKTETLFEGKFVNKYVIHKGDVLVGMDGDFNIVRWKGNQGLLNQRILRIRSKNEDILDTIFLYYYIEPFLKKINDKTGQTTVKHLSIYDFYPLELYRPKIEAQRKIAAILRNVDDLINETKELIGKHKKMKFGLMQDLFTKGTDENRKPDADFKNSELGKVPKSWEISILGKSAFVTKLAGFEYTDYFDYSVGGEITVIRALNLKEGKLDLSDIHTIPKKTSMNLPRSRLVKGDIVVSYVGTVGEVAIIPSDDKFHLGPNVAKISINKKLFHPKFVLYQLISESGKRRIMDLVASTTQMAISMSRLRTLKLVRPSLSEQERITKILDSMESKIISEESYLVKLVWMKAGLMQDMLTGKLRVAN